MTLQETQPIKLYQWWHGTTTHNLQSPPMGLSLLPRDHGSNGAQADRSVDSTGTGHGDVDQWRQSLHLRALYFGGSSRPSGGTGGVSLGGSFFCLLALFRDTSEPQTDAMAPSHNRGGVQMQITKHKRCIICKGVNLSMCMDAHSDRTYRPYIFFWWQCTSILVAICTVRTDRTHFW